jgi:hypothetical protein
MSRMNYLRLAECRRASLGFGQPDACTGRLASPSTGEAPSVGRRERHEHQRDLHVGRRRTPIR